MQVAEARACTHWSENGWAGWRRPQHLGEAGHQILALFSLACRSCASVSSLNMGQLGRMGSAFFGVVFIQGLELQACCGHLPRPSQLYRGPQAGPVRCATLGPNFSALELAGCTRSCAAEHCFEIRPPSPAASSEPRDGMTGCSEALNTVRNGSRM